MKKILYLIIGVLFFSLLFCSRESEVTGEPEKITDLLRSNYRSSEIRKYYSSKTVEVLEKFGKKNGVSDSELTNILSIIPEKAEFQTLLSKKGDDKCIIKVKFTGGVAENLKGLEISLPVVKEDGAWKVDRTGDFRKMLESVKPGNHESYFER